MHPSVESGGAFFAAAAGLNPHGVRDALDGVSEADFLVDEETRKPNPMRLAWRLLPTIWVISSCLLLLHDPFLRL
jgi:hypothetical protein